jgi:uncharacterized protein YciI
MKVMITFLLVVLSIGTFAQAKHPKTFKMPPSEPGKDSMVLKQYFFVMLTRGARRGEITDTAIINKLQAGHMANMTRLAKEGKLLVAGPFGDDGNWRGIFVFDCDTKEEAEEILKSDPAIKAGRLDYEVHPWWTAMNSVYK